MSPEDRSWIHTAWRDDAGTGEVKVVCATIAFGMGINASNCRFVIHSTMSKGLDSYWQEAGRAGRDGSLAACTVFARGADLTRLSSMVAEVPSQVSRTEQLKRLYAAFMFALQPAQECRRSSLLRWFGQDPRKAVERCKANGRCDVCDPVIAADADEEGCAVDVADHLLCLLQIVQRLERRGGAGASKLTLIKLADNWRSAGAAQKSVREGDPTNGEAPLATAPYSKENCERVVAVAICTSLLEENFSQSSYSYNAYVRLGKDGRDVLQGSKQLEPTSVWLSKAAVGAAEKASAKAAGGVAKKRKAGSVAAATKAKPAPAAAAASAAGARSDMQQQHARAPPTSWEDDDDVSSGGSDIEWKREVAKIERAYQGSGDSGAAAGASAWPSASSGRPAAAAAAARPSSNGRKRGGSKLSKVSRMKLGKAVQAAQAQAANVSQFAEHDRRTMEAAAAASAVSAVAAATAAASASHTEVGGQVAKKRRVPVPADDDDEEPKYEYDGADAEAEFMEDMQQMQAEFGGPTHNSDDDSFDVGADDLFDQRRRNCRHNNHICH